MLGPDYFTRATKSPPNWGENTKDNKVTYFQTKTAPANTNIQRLCLLFFFCLFHYVVTYSHCFFLLFIISLLLFFYFVLISFFLSQFWTFCFFFFFFFLIIGNTFGFLNFLASIPAGVWGFELRILWYLRNH